MKKHLFPVLLLLILFAACKKKKDSPNVTMTVNVGSDSAWSTTNVSAYYNSTTFYIIGTNNITNDEVRLGLFNYRAGNKTYNISNNGGTAGNIYGSTGEYDHGGFAAEGVTGYISVTGSAANTVLGSYYFTSNGGAVSGSFAAPVQ